MRRKIQLGFVLWLTLTKFLQIFFIHLLISHLLFSYIAGHSPFIISFLTENNLSLRDLANFNVENTHCQINKVKKWEGGARMFKKEGCLFKQNKLEEIIQTKHDCSCGRASNIQDTQK